MLHDAFMTIYADCLEYDGDATYPLFEMVLLSKGRVKKIYLAPSGHMCRRVDLG